MLKKMRQKDFGQPCGKTHLCSGVDTECFHRVPEGFESSDQNMTWEHGRGIGMDYEGLYFHSYNSDFRKKGGQYERNTYALVVYVSFGRLSSELSRKFIILRYSLKDALLKIS